MELHLVAEFLDSIALDSVIYPEIFAAGQESIQLHYRAKFYQFQQLVKHTGAA